MGRLRAYWRLIIVVIKFFPIFISYARDRRRFVLFGGSRKVGSEFKKNRASSIKKKMLSLGPTFIKLGQVLSTRPDVLPPEYTEVFSTLQDEVPAAPWSNVEKIFKDEFDEPAEDMYDSFDKEPISGASLGQVYTAEIDEQDVAVKVRRPGIESQVKADVQVLEWLTPILMWFVGEGRAFSLETLSDEFSDTLVEEMDYERELNELKTVRDNFSDDPMVIIPEPIEKCSSERILTMEYIDGTKIDNLEEIDRMGVDKTELADRVQEAYFQMIIEHGVFHADPHPGNLAVKPDGSVIFYDFGMTGRIDTETRDKLVEFYVSVAREYPERALDALIDLEIIDPDADRDLMIDVLEIAIKDARGEDIEQRKIEDILVRIEDQLYEFPFRLPPRFSLLLRVATIANGVCINLNPDLDFISVITDLLKENGYIEDSVRKLVKNEAEELQDTLDNASKFPSRVDEAVKRVNNGQVEASVSISDREFFKNLVKRIILSVFFSGFIIAGTILYVFSGVLESTIPFAMSFIVLFFMWRSSE